MVESLLCVWWLERNVALWAEMKIIILLVGFMVETKLPINTQIELFPKIVHCPYFFARCPIPNPAEPRCISYQSS
jgi:hypothetical protein